MKGRMFLMKKIISVCLALAMLAAMTVMMIPTASAAWDGSSVSAGLVGSGTEFDPYLISSENDLAFVAKQVNDAVTNEMKQKILGVKEETLASYGAVSEQTAREMAAGIRRVSGADIGISVTGIAGPNSDGTNKPVGLCYIAIDTEDYKSVEKIETGKNDREYNRYVTASRALNLARVYTEKRG